MADRSTANTATIENFRVNFNGLVTDIGDFANLSSGFNATNVVGAINEIFAGFNLASQISGEAANYIQSSNAETLNLIGGTGVHSGSETTNIVTDNTADDTMSFLLNEKISLTRITPSSGTNIVFGTATDGSGTNYQIKFASPGDTTIDFGSTQGFAAAMSVALG